jgi:ABC-type transport system involved in cytochrome bd biosynthesis fused ATPase/permease subunit
VVLCDPMRNSPMDGLRVTQVTVQLEKVCKDYGDGRVVNALLDLDLSVAQGERVAIMGPSGSGNPHPRRSSFSNESGNGIDFHGYV